MQKEVRTVAISPRQLRMALAALAAAVAIGLVTPSLAQGSATRAADREFDHGVQLFKDGRRSMAFGIFVALANRGDVDAARIALFLNQYGATLYGAHWEAGREDVDYWTTLVRNSSTAGRPQPAFEPLAVVPRARVKQVRSSAVVVGRHSGE